MLLYFHLLFPPPLSPHPCPSPARGEGTRNGFTIAQPTVSKHLKQLQDAGLVSYRKEGLWVNYYLTEDSRNPYAAILIENLKHWLGDDPEITRLVEKIPTLNREILCKR